MQTTRTVVSISLCLLLACDTRNTSGGRSDVTEADSVQSPDGDAQDVSADRQQERMSATFQPFE